ncbi:toll/interleukin-1 receptor domain-containing protein [Phormidium nigroviride]
MKEAFISYSRKDLEFVQKLFDSFCQEQREVWFDQKNIPLTADWRKEMYIGIEESQNFVFIISPDSVTSKPCLEEIEHAVLHNKRLLPIMYRKTPSSTVHPAIRSLNFIPFPEDCDFDAHFKTLIAAIDTDLTHVKAHTRLQLRAIEWDKKNRDVSFLLRGSDLREAESWIEESTNKEPKPTPLHTQYLIASGQGEIKRQRATIGAVGVGLVACVVLAAVALGQREEAIHQRNFAREQEIQALTSLSQAKLLTEDQLDAMTASIKAAKQLQQTKNASEKLQNLTRDGLRQAVFKVQEKNRFEGHTAEVNSLSFSPDGNLIASASHDRSIKIWKRDGTLVATLPHAQAVRSVNFSHDGQLIASASFDKTVKLWKIDGTLVATLEHKEPVRGVAFSPGDKIIVSGTTNGYLLIWSLKGELLKTIAAHNRDINSVTFSPDGQLIATASSDKTVKLWTFEGELIQTLSGHRDRVWEVNFSPDSQTIATAAADNNIKLWKNENPIQIRQEEIKESYLIGDASSTVPHYLAYMTLQAHTNWVRSVSFSPDGQTIASSSYDKTIKLWNISGVLIRTFQGSNGGIKSIRFSPDGSTIASSSTDGIIKLRSIQGTLVEVLQGHRSGIKGVRFSPNGKLIASVGVDDTIKFWSSTGSLLRNLNYGAGLTNVNFSPDGKTIATPSYDNTVQLWNLNEALKNPLAVPFRHFVGHTSTVNNISISPDGKLMASASADGTVKLWSLKDGTMLKSMDAHLPEATDVTFTKDSKKLVTVGSDGNVNLWDIEGNLLQKFRAHSEWINALMFNSKRNMLATSAGDKLVKLWQLNAEGLFETTPYKILEGSKDWVFDVAFGDSDQLVAAGSKDGTVRIWNLDGKLVTTLDEHRDWVLAVAFSPDGQKLASASADKTVILWTLESLRQLEVAERSTDINSLLVRGCDSLRDYLKTNPKIEEHDRTLCDGIKKTKEQEALGLVPQN